MTDSDDGSAEGVTLGSVLGALGSAVASLKAAPAGTQVPIRSVSLLDGDDLALAETGVPLGDLCVLAGVSSEPAQNWLDRLAADDPALKPAAIVTKDASAELCHAAETAGIAVAALHAQARAELVLSTVRSLIEGAAARPQPDALSGEPFAEASDLYALAQRVAVLTGGLVSIEDDQSRLLAYSATDGDADELRMLSILAREGPAEHLRRLQDLGVFERLRRSPAAVEVPADQRLGWRRRLVVSIQPLAALPASRPRPLPLGTIWLQEGRQRLDPDAASVLEGAAALAARLIHRSRTAPTQEALQTQRLFGVHGGGIDVPSLASALALPTSGPAVVIGITPSSAEPATGSVSQIAAALRLHAAAFTPDSLVTGTRDRMYVLIPRSRSDGIAGWVAAVLDRLEARFGSGLRAAIAAPVSDLTEVPGARAEVDRVLDRPGGVERVTTLTESRTPILLGEIAELVGSRPELQDPRLRQLLAYDRAHDAALVATLERYLLRFGDVRTAAEELHIHPNTLRYRIRRAGQLLGMDLDDPDARLLLQIQLLARSRSD